MCWFGLFNNLWFITRLCANPKKSSTGKGGGEECIYLQDEKSSEMGRKRGKDSQVGDLQIWQEKNNQESYEEGRHLWAKNEKF